MLTTMNMIAKLPQASFLDSTCIGEPTASSHAPNVNRRRVLASLGGAMALPWGLTGCVGMPGPDANPSAEARRILLDCAQAHGAAAWQNIRDIAVSYDGVWYDLIQRVQPVLVDARYRQSSQERLLLQEPVMHQQHRGRGGTKAVLRQGLETAVSYDGVRATDAEVLASAGLVADAYRVFITSPFCFLPHADRVRLGPTELLGGVEHDVLLVSRSPGLGWNGEDRFALYVNRRNRLLGRVRFTLEALASTRGAVVEVDFSGHRTMHGVVWPTRFFERVRTPLPLLSAHRWWVTGLDVNRGLSARDLNGPAPSANAARPATAIG